jgi:cobalt-precorrin-5B (C1)-methyltransferase
MRSIDIPFPGGTRHVLKIEEARLDGEGVAALASVIKDAGDDPDVTDGAEIVARVRFTHAEGEPLQSAGLPSLIIRGGEGVGVVTRPGLEVAVGEAAITTGPRGMIREAVAEALLSGQRAVPSFLREVEVTVSVVRGASIALSTLNSRLGIVGGISILGTTGIVRPLSSEAWTATIRASMDVALAMGREEIVLSTGRRSERAHMERYGLPEESYVMMGDYLAIALLEAGKRAFKRVHLCAQWAKMLKAAMGTPETHVRKGAIDPERAALFLRGLGAPGLGNRAFNTAREILDLLGPPPADPRGSILAKVCAAARQYAESLTGGIPVAAHLVSYEGEIIAEHG